MYEDMQIPTGVLPAVRKMKDFEKALETDYPTIVILESRLAQMKSLINYAKKANKRTLVHFDLIQGLKSDEYGMEFLIREMKPDGIVTTRSSVITLAKKHRVKAIQRLFLLDSIALENNLKLIKKVKPDYIEVLPGLIPSIIREINEQVDIPIIAGGLIRTTEEVNAALDAGAIAVSTSNTDLW